MSEIRLYGELKEKFGGSLSLEVHSPAEAIRALCSVLPGFREFVTTSEDRNIGYQVLVDDTARGWDELHSPMGPDILKIVPVVYGAKSKVEKIIVGAVMVYVGYQMGGMDVIPKGAEMSTMQMAGKMVINFGVSMIFSGIAEMLAPDPKPEVEAPENYHFDGPVNTERQGVPVPIAYGLVRVGGAVINAQVVAEDKG